jgi:hypothetical protein
VRNDEEARKRLDYWRMEMARNDREKRAFESALRAEERYQTWCQSMMESSDQDPIDTEDLLDCLNMLRYAQEAWTLAHIERLRSDIQG